ncbi:MAG: hypothetical protein WD135_06360 [Ferruginibacter sp.]
MIKQLLHIKSVARIISVIFCLLFWVFLSKAIAGNTDDIKKVSKTAIHFSRHHTGKVLVEIKALENQNIELYIFDAEGILVKKIDAFNKKTDKTIELYYGQYIYQCFDKDTQLKSGKLFVNQNNINYD